VTNLPKLVRLAPTLFYLAAAIFFLVSAALIFLQVGNMFSAMNAVPPAAVDAFAAGVQGTMRLAIVGGLLQAAFGALLLMGIGIISRILLAIASSRSVASVYDARGTSHEDTH
jgi:hypothetical protein